MDRFGDEKGSIEFDPDTGAARITLNAAADPSTFIHQMAHWARRALPTHLQNVAGNLYGVVNGNWTVPQEEQFALDYERYTYDGKAPVPEHQALFTRMAAWMRQTYPDLHGSSIECPLTDEKRAFFDLLLGKVGQDESVNDECDIDGIPNSSTSIARLPKDRVYQKMKKMPRSNEIRQNSSNKSTRPSQKGILELARESPELRERLNREESVIAKVHALQSNPQSGPIATRNGLQSKSLGTGYTLRRWAGALLSSGRYMAKVMQTNSEYRFKAILVAPSALLVLGFAVFVWPTQYQYFKSGSTNYRTNRFTGKTQVLSDGGWTKAVADSYNPPAAPQPYPLDATDLANLSPNCTLSNSDSELSVQCHNPTNYKLQDVTISVSGTVRNGNKFTDREYILNSPYSPVGPLSDGTFTCPFNNEFDVSGSGIQWYIESATVQP